MGRFSSVMQKRLLGIVKPEVKRYCKNTDTTKLVLSSLKIGFLLSVKDPTVSVLRSGAIDFLVQTVVLLC